MGKQSVSLPNRNSKSPTTLDAIPISIKNRFNCDIPYVDTQNSPTLWFCNDYISPYNIHKTKKRISSRVHHSEESRYYFNKNTMRNIIITKDYGTMGFWVATFPTDFLCLSDRSLPISSMRRLQSQRMRIILAFKESDSPPNCPFSLKGNIQKPHYLCEYSN